MISVVSVILQLVPCPRRISIGKPLSRKTSIIRRFSASTRRRTSRCRAPVREPRAEPSGWSRGPCREARRPTSNAISASVVSDGSNPACATIRSGSPIVATTLAAPRSGAPAAQPTAWSMFGAAVKKRNRRASSDRPFRNRSSRSRPPARVSNVDRGAVTETASDLSATVCTPSDDARRLGRLGAGVLDARRAARHDDNGHGATRIISIAVLPTMTLRIGP